MKSNDHKINQLVETLPNGFARHQVVLDDQGSPTDYIFLNVNSAFEEMTGLKRENILDRKVTEVLPGIEKGDFDWIGVYGKVALEGKSLHFEQYSEPLKRWYDVQVYSDEKGFFTTVFNEITKNKEELASMKGLLELTEKLFSTDLATFDYQSATDNLLKLSGAKFAAINTYEESRTKTVTRAISGIPSMIEQVSKILGFKITGQAWDIIPERLRKIEGGKLVRFSSLYETAMGTLNKATSTSLHKLTGIGDIYVLELSYGGLDTLGDIIFFMPKGKGINNREVIEIYAGQLAAVLGRLRSEEKLLKNEQRLSLAQVNARAGYWEYDIREEKLYWSRECEALFGLNEGEFEGTFDAFLKRVHQEDKEYVLSRNQPVTEQKESILLDYEHRIIKKGGTVLWVRETADTVYDEKGEAAFVTGFVMDITERKLVEEALQESENRFNLAISGTGAGLWDWDMVNDKVFFSPYWKTMLGYTDDEIENAFSGWQKLWHPEDAEKIKKAVQDHLDGKTEKYEIEHRVLHKDGNYRHILTRGDLIKDEKGQPVRWVGTNIDLTHIKQMEAELRESEARLNQFFSQSLTGFFFMMLDEPVIWDETTDKEKTLDYIFHHQRMTKVNQAMLEQYGAAEEDFIGKTPYELFKHDLEHGRYIWRGLFDQGRWHVETNERRMDGTPIIIDGDYICLYDSEGRITGHFGVQVDITEQKDQAEQIVRLAQEQDILLNNIDAQIWYLTDVQTYGAVNEAHAAFFGVGVSDLAHKTLWEIMQSEEEVKICTDGNKQVFSDKMSIKTEEYVANGQGEKRLLAITKTPMLDHEGNVKHVVCSAVDITDRKKAEETLAEHLAFEKLVSGISSTFVNLSLEELDNGIYETLKAVGLYFNADRSYLYRFSEDGKTYTNTHNWCAPGVEAYMEKDQNRTVEPESCWEGELLKGNTVIINDVEAMPPELETDKQDFQLEEIKSLLTIPLAWDGKVFGCFGLDHVKEKHTWTGDQVDLLKVIAELIAGAIARYDADRQIRKLSFNDQLTGLYNRRYFENEMERLDKSREHPVAVISADLDGLKLVNDTLGHSEGDRYLRTGAELLKNSLRASDILARVGGDEFAILLPRSSKAEANMLITRVRRQVEDYNLAQIGLPLSISLGLAVSESPDYPLEEVYRAADNNMYNNKLQQGKKARAEIVSSLLASLFERGNLAEGDREQVQELSIRLGQALKLEEGRMANLELLAQVYDLGKVGLPDSLLHNTMLTKAEELTDAEREAIFRHPETGYRIAMASPELTGVSELVLRHHENFDGSGYPLELKGEEIPLENRILSIAIAYSAMTNPRPYADTLSHEEALAELRRCADSQFDPQLVKNFVEMF